MARARAAGPAGGVSRVLRRCRDIPGSAGLSRDKGLVLRSAGYGAPARPVLSRICTCISTCIFAVGAGIRAHQLVTPDPAIPGMRQVARLNTPVGTTLSAAEAGIRPKDGDV